MSGDLGNDTAQASLEAAKKLAEMAGKLLSFLFKLVAPDYDKKIAKERYKQLRANGEKTYRIGRIRAREMQKSGEPITYAKFSMSEEQFRQFCKLAKQRGVTVSALQNKNGDEKTYIAMYFTKDSAIVEDITEQLIRDNKLETIEKAMVDVAGYKKVDLNREIDTLGDGRIIKEPVIICDSNNPYNYIEVSSRQEVSEEGHPFVNTEYKVFHEGRQQKCSEFAHGKFTHYTDKSGKNTSNYGDEHWQNMKKEIQQKSGIGEESLKFRSRVDYEKYVSQWENNKEQVERDSKLYDELGEEKEQVIRDDINSYNDKQAENIMKDISNEKQTEEIIQPLRFDDTVDRFQCNGWEKEEPYYICNRTDPDNYMEVNSEKAEFKDTEYTKHTYNIYVDDKPVENPAREDGKWTDERFVGRPADFWKKTKEQMKEAGDFTNDMVVFYSKEEMLEYRKAYEIQKENAKENTKVYETGKENFQNNYAEVINNLKAEIKEYEDIGTYENGIFTIDTGDNITSLPDIKDPRCVEAGVIAEQISTFEKINRVENQIAEANLQYDINERSELKGSPMYNEVQESLKNKVSDLEKQVKELEGKAQELSENREKLAGIKAEKTVAGNHTKAVNKEAAHTHADGRTTMKQLKEDVAKVQAQKGVSAEQIKAPSQHKIKNDKER